jgi:hypothetical protein
MTNLRQRFEQVVSSAQRRLIEQNQILPVKTEEGILVGSVLIKTRETQKDLWQYNSLVYEGVFLNKAAIRLANLLANYRRTTMNTDSLYKLDQEYGRWFIESQALRSKLHYARQQGEFDRADIILARYTIAKDRVEYAKKQVLALAMP